VVAAIVILLSRFGVLGFRDRRGVATASALFGCFNSDEIVLAMSRARPADKPTYKRHHNLVGRLCIAAGLPEPRLYVVIDDAATKFFATGRDARRANPTITHRTTARI
jgi:heat shock protein HtpX